jgi:hypothetical protein
MLIGDLFLLALGFLLQDSVAYAEERTVFVRVGQVFVSNKTPVVQLSEVLQPLVRGGLYLHEQGLQ